MSARGHATARSDPGGHAGASPPLDETELRKLFAGMLRATIGDRATIRELASALQVNRETMRRLLKGQASPRLSLLVSLLNVYGMDAIGSILRGTGGDRSPRSIPK